jgi:protein-S-isoprenylcysteine O-methyltransferase Ste14
MSPARAAIFVLVSVGIVAVSWPALRNPRMHGFPRFFAFEGLLTLVLLNARSWFRDMRSVRQIAASLLLTAALVLAVHGFILLRRVGKPRGSFEDTTALVVVGAYRWIRHPLYGSVLLLAWGTFLKQVSAASTCLVLAVTLLLVVTAKVEEAENLQRFGAEYRAYMSRTRMFIPYLL